MDLNDNLFEILSQKSRTGNVLLQIYVLVWVVKLCGSIRAGIEAGMTNMATDDDIDGKIFFRNGHRTVMFDGCRKHFTESRLTGCGGYGLADMFCAFGMLLGFVVSYFSEMNSYM